MLIRTATDGYNGTKFHWVCKVFLKIDQRAGQTMAKRKADELYGQNDCSYRVRLSRKLFNLFMSMGLTSINFAPHA